VNASIAYAPPDAPAASPGEGPRFVLARDRGERAAEINALYNRFTGKRRSMDAYQWEFYAGPAGPALIWTITEAATGQIVGHHSLVPTPLARRGQVVPAGRTENTIVDRSVRSKLFYPGMERRALAEATQTLDVLYTVDATEPGPLRRRFGYRPVGRWTAFLAKIEPAYLRALLQRARGRLGVAVPDWALGGLARGAGWTQRLVRMGGRSTGSAAVAEVADLGVIGAEYDAFWTAARPLYDVTIDRSLAFMLWRFRDNPHLRFRTWTIRRDGRLEAVVVGHAHALGGATALYVDDIVVGRYDEAAFAAVLACLGRLDARAEAIVLMTLAIDTPFHRALRRRFPLQAAVLRRVGHRVFGELMALEPDGGAPWYVTPIFTEGMNTSR